MSGTVDLSSTVAPTHGVSPRLARHFIIMGFIKSYSCPFVWLSSILIQSVDHIPNNRPYEPYRRVIGVVFATVIASFFSSSNPVRMPYLPILGRCFETSSSRVVRPACTHCKAATAVISFVIDASEQTVSSWNGIFKPSLRDALPLASEYSVFPATT